MTNRTFWIILIIVFFIAGAAGGVFLLRMLEVHDRQSPSSSVQSPVMESVDTSVLRIYLPGNNQLELKEIKIPGRISTAAIAEAVIEEFFKQTGQEGVASIPQNVTLRGLYRDDRLMYYIDLSDEVRRNFQGDALSEYLLLKGIYESLLSNVQDFQDVKILVEGKELETLGGHVYLKYPLKNTFSAETREDRTVQHEE